MDISNAGQGSSGSDAPGSVDNPGDKPETSGEPVDNPQSRLLVLGSEDWPWPAVVAQAMLDWWINQGRPNATLVVDGRGRFAELAIGAWNHQVFPMEVHDLDGGALRNPERALKRSMTEAGLTHALIFRYGPDPYVVEWIDYLTELSALNQNNGIVGFTATLIQIDEVEA